MAEKHNRRQNVIAVVTENGNKKFSQSNKLGGINMACTSANNKNGSGGQERLFRFIMEVSFALEDVVLYLDTHPCDKDALCYYEQYKNFRNQALAEYTRMYGPLNSKDVNNRNYWRWIETPWPWE